MKTETVILWLAAAYIGVVLPGCPVARVPGCAGCGRDGDVVVVDGEGATNVFEYRAPVVTNATQDVGCPAAPRRARVKSL